MLLLGLVGAVVGGWFGSGEPMTLLWLLGVPLGLIISAAPDSAHGKDGIAECSFPNGNRAALNGEG